MVISDRTKGCCSSDLNEPRTLTMTNLLNLTHTTEIEMAVELRSEFLCTLTGYVAPAREVGATPRGMRRFFPAIGGSFEGPRLRGEVLSDGGDWLLTRADGVLEQDVRATLKTDDGAFIYVQYAGMRHGPPEIIAQLARGETVDPGKYYFRVAPVVETGAAR